MLQRQLGRSGPATSAIGIGAMSFSNFYGPASDAQAFEVLSRAMDLQITHIDTANICLLYTSPSPRDLSTSRMPSSA